MKRRALLFPFFLSFIGANQCASQCQQKKDTPTTKPKAAQPCPGDSKRSATSATACVCDKGQVLRAGSLSCATCDPAPSNGDYCECADNDGIFSLNARIDTQLSLTSDQVQCSPEGECDPGMYPDRAGKCQTCGKGDCGACGPCNVGETCISGKCVAASQCYVLASAPPDTPNGQPSVECDYSPGDACKYGTIRTLPTWTTCQCSDSVGCAYASVAYPLTAPPDCPGGSKMGSNGACTCPSGQVLRAGALECDDCDPTGSKGSYCDCGKNSVLSMDAKLDGYLNLTSPQAFCSDKVACDDGSYAGANGDCVKCAAGDCGVCGPCKVGETCISGKCVGAAGCRVTHVEAAINPETNEPYDVKDCLYSTDAFCSFAFLRSAPTGAACTCPADYNDCTYSGKSEPLSQ